MIVRQRMVIICKRGLEGWNLSAKYLLTGRRKNPPSQGRVSLTIERWKTKIEGYFFPNGTMSIGYGTENRPKCAVVHGYPTGTNYHWK
jgi:hypothetical protein